MSIPNAGPDTPYVTAVPTSYIGPSVSVAGVLWVWNATTGEYEKVVEAPYATLSALNAAVLEGYRVVGKAYPYVTGYLVWTATGWMGDLGVFASFGDLPTTQIAPGSTASVLVSGVPTVYGYSNSAWGPLPLSGVPRSYPNLTRRGSGCRTAVIFGDSVVQREYSILPWFCVTHGGYSIPSNYNQGVSGNTSTQILARLLAFDLSQVGLVIFSATTNDPATSVPIATTISNLNSALAYCTRNNCEMLVALSHPWGGTSSAIANVAVMNSAVMSWCARNHVPYGDPWRHVRNPITGGAISGSWDTSSPYHPLNTYYPQAGINLANDAIATNLLRQVPHNANALMSKANVLCTNPLAITDTNADGVADLWRCGGDYGGPASAGVIASLEARGGSLGNFQKIITTNTAGQSIKVYSGMTGGGNWEYSADFEITALGGEYFSIGLQDSQTNNPIYHILPAGTYRGHIIQNVALASPYEYDYRAITSGVSGTTLKLGNFASISLDAIGDI